MTLLIRVFFQHLISQDKNYGTNIPTNLITLKYLCIFCSALVYLMRFFYFNIIAQPLSNHHLGRTRAMNQYTLGMLSYIGRRLPIVYCGLW